VSSKFKVGDRVVLIDHPMNVIMTKDLLVGTIVCWDDNEEHLGVRWDGYGYDDSECQDCHAISNRAIHLEIYNSPLYKALNEN
jgi:hypothetical protein